MKKIILLSFFILSVTFLSCKKDSTSHTVEYTIQGTSKSNITYTDQNGNTQSVSNVGSSWTYGFSSSDHGQALRLTVASLDGSSVGGKIFIDGQQSAQNNGSASITISSILP